MFDPSLVAYLTSPTLGHYSVRLGAAKIPITAALATSGSTESYDAPTVASALEDVSRTFFEERVRDWLSDTEHESSLSRIIGHPRFEEIVAMREPALRFILQRMLAGEVHIHWFPALKRIARYDPVPVEERGYVPQMARAWIDWGRNHGKI